MWVFEVEGVGGVEEGYCFGVAIICIVLDPHSLLLYRSRTGAVVMEPLLTHDGSFVRMAETIAPLIVRSGTIRPSRIGNRVGISVFTGMTTQTH